MWRHQGGGGGRREQRHETCQNSELSPSIEALGLGKIRTFVPLNRVWDLEKVRAFPSIEAFSSFFLRLWNYNHSSSYIGFGTWKNSKLTAVSIRESSFGKISFGKVASGECPFGKISFGKMSLRESGFGKVSWNRWRKIGERLATGFGKYKHCIE